MTSIGQVIGAVLLTAGVAIASSANAAPVVDEILGTPTSITVGSPLSFTHDFTDNAAPNGYAIGVDSISSALLLIVLTDDNGNEDYTISFGTAPQVNDFTANIAGDTSFSFSVLAPSLADLSATGTLGVTISALECNGAACDSYALKFVSSTLTAEVARATLSTNTVPEPSSLLLLAAGFFGLGAAARRR